MDTDARAFHSDALRRHRGDRGGGCDDRRGRKAEQCCAHVPLHRLFTRQGKCRLNNDQWLWFQVVAVPLPSLSTLAIELALLGDALERFAGALDAVLVVVTVGGQQFDDLVAAADTSAAHRARIEEDRLADRELVSFQRYSPVRNDRPTPANKDNG